MKQYYECHITIDPLLKTTSNFQFKKRTAEIKKAVEQVRWTFSEINGDPDLGDGIKCYATKHINKKFSPESIAVEMGKVAEFISDSCDCKILRKKIELVIYDDR